MSIKDRRREWEAEQAARISNTDDAILALANEIYADMVKTQVARVRGERQKGALAGLGFTEWIGPWGGWTSPDTALARNRIMRSLRHKPYFPRLGAVGLVGHPQRRLGLRAEWLKPYCRIDGETVLWGLEDTRERDDVFAAKYDHVYLKVLDEDDSVLAGLESGAFDNTTALSHLGLADDDCRIEVGYASHVWGRGGSWFDFSHANGEWKLLPPQGAGQGGE